MNEVAAQVDRRSEVDAAAAAAETRAGRDPLRRRLLATADMLAVSIAAVAVALVGYGVDVAVWTAMVAPLWIVLAKLYGLYDRDHRTVRHLTADELGTIGAWALTGTAATLLALEATPVGTPPLGAAAAIWLIASVSDVGLRAAARALFRGIVPPERVAIVGAGAPADVVRRKLELFDDIHADAVAQVASVPGAISLAASGAVDRVIVSSQPLDNAALGDLVRTCRRVNARLSVVPPSRGSSGTAVQLNHVAELPLVEYGTWDVSQSTLLLKRALDVVAATSALVLTLPLLPLIALALKLDSPGPVLFAQRRAGLHGRPFTMRKFRTMTADAEARLVEVVSLETLETPMFKLRQDPRVTRVGRFLRRWSLDELPQLVNVIGGDMSLVGPRPEQVELVEQYAPEHRFRLGVKPGVTGPMQVYGRGALTFEERLAVERDYLENISIGRDLRILAHTLAAVARGKGAY